MSSLGAEKRLFQSTFILLEISETNRARDGGINFQAWFSTRFMFAKNQKQVAQYLQKSVH